MGVGSAATSVRLASAAAVLRTALSDPRFFALDGQASIATDNSSRNEGSGSTAARADNADPPQEPQLHRPLVRQFVSELSNLVSQIRPVSETGVFVSR
jgi:hypothetical protein